MLREIYRRLPAAVLVLIAGHVAHAEVIERVRISADQARTRVVLDLSGPAEHRLFALADPQRIVVDLPDTSVRPNLPALPARGLVQRIRTGQRPDATSRVVLDVAGPVISQSFMLPPDGESGYRLVVDLSREPQRRAALRAPGADNPRGRDLVIAIDAGHGGKDPGASGRHGAIEKDVVMRIARLLANEIEAQPGFSPLLIRDSDTFVSLRERTQRARNAEADFFVSIHADAFANSSARGATVYVLSEKGATDEAGRRLAQRENDADLIGGVSLADQESDIAPVILDITQTAALSASLAAAEDIISQLGTVTQLRKREVQQAGFVVLKAPDIPSVLIETAYLSNPREEAALSSSEHQGKLARALGAGIVNYFFDNPPPGTYLAMNPTLRPREPMRHAVASGETLSQIAERYRISLVRLKNSNALKSDRIRIGQVLTIPRG
ncbi:MAG: N-acetylmuramoyl-L-alanine amidase [Gammaproteobacteria bacterium]